MNLNKVILIGRLTNDPELRQTGSGKSVANFSIATNQYWSKDGEKKESTEFHNIVVWGKTADTVDSYLSKGQQVAIEGRLQTRTWEDNNGSKRRTTEIVADNVQFGSRQEESALDKEMEEEDLPEINIDEEGDDIDPDDIPF